MEGVRTSCALAIWVRGKCASICASMRHQPVGESSKHRRNGAAASILGNTAGARDPECSTKLVCTLESLSLGERWRRSRRRGGSFARNRRRFLRSIVSATSLRSTSFVRRTNIILSAEGRNIPLSFIYYTRHICRICE